MDDSDLWDDVEGGEGDFADRWEWDGEVGKTLTGTLSAGPKNVPTKFGDVPVIEVTDATGKEWGLMLTHANLRAQLKAARPRKGDTVAIRYDGLGEAKPGKNAPNLYTVEVKRQEATPVAAEPQPAAPTPTASLL